MDLLIKCLIILKFTLLRNLSIIRHSVYNLVDCIPKATGKLGLSRYIKNILTMYKFVEHLTIDR